MSEEIIRIAVAGSEGGAVDQHFGQAEEFLIFEIAAGTPRLAERRAIAAHAQGDEDRRDTIVRMLADCKALLVAKIGVAPKEKLAAAGIDATDAHANKPVEAALAKYLASGAAAAVAEAAEEAPIEPPDTGRFRLLHAMLRVSDMERSLDFYTRLLGMRVLDRRDHKKNQFTQVYLGYGDAEAPMVLELVQNWSREEPYLQGEAFGHIAIGVTGIGALCRYLAAEGVPMPRPPRSQRHGDTIVAFVEDPDGFRIELVQTAEVAQAAQ